MPEKKLTIGMATYDDFDGVYFTVQSLRLHHPEVAEEVELLIVDNHPGGPCAEALQELGKQVPYRYLATREIRGTAVRDLIFREARTPYVLCVDCHILVALGAIRRLITFLDQRPDCQDLLQGPLVFDDLRSVSTHFDPIWSHAMYGVWATDERGRDPEGEPFEIPMQGLGIFACRKDAWLGFNPRFAGFGGEEGYIHEKFRQAGRRTLCLPFLRWLHRFNRPSGTQYPNTLRDRLRNYLIGHEELALDPEPCIAHFLEHMKAELVDLDTEYIEALPGEIRQELSNPLLYFDAVYCINLESATERRQEMQRRLELLGVADRVRWFAAVETPDSHHVGCALSHRAILEQARKHGLENVLVFEDDAIFLDDALECLSKSVAELRAQDWNTFQLGGHRWGEDFPDAPGCSFLQDLQQGLSCTHAIAYNRPVFGKILDDLPKEVEDMEKWLETYKGIDQYLNGIGKRFLCRPIVASQLTLLDQEDAEYRDRFTLGDFEPDSDLPEPEGVLGLSPGYDVINLEDRVVLFKTERTQTLALSATGGIILELVDGRRTVAEIRELLQAAYPESAGEIARDVDHTLGHLIRSGAVR